MQGYVPVFHQILQWESLGVAAAQGAAGGTTAGLEEEE